MKFAPVTQPKPPALIAWSLALGLLLVLLATGCRAVSTAVKVPGEAIRAVSPGQKDKPPLDPVEVQQRLLRFANEFAAATMLGVEKLQRGTNAVDPGEVLKLKLLFASEATSIASGPNAVGNLLDMTVFVTVATAAVDEYWQPKVYGASALPLGATFRSYETEIWKLAGLVLKPGQQTELRQAIAAWRQQHPVMENVLGFRASAFAKEVAPTQPATPTESGSVFGLLRLDPLAGLDPATREIAQTRMFAERALFIAQWMPSLLRWQLELLSLNALKMPEVQQLVTNSTQLTASVDRFARVAEQLPGQLSAEREAILKALEAQEKNLALLVNEVHGALTAGSQMSTSLNTTLITFDALMQRFGVGATNAVTPPDTNSPPFNILDYAKTAAQLEATARQLTELLRTLDQTTGSNNLGRISAQLTPVVQQAQTGGKEIVDYAFWKGILLVGIVLLAALIYRWLGARRFPLGKNKSTLS